MALHAHNVYREKQSGYTPIKLDMVMSKFMQAGMKKPGFAGTIAEKGAYKKCGENKFVQTDLTKLSALVLTNIATDTWYNGKDEYNFATGSPKAPGDAEKSAKSNAFARVVWKATTKVAFGVQDNYVIAWYCEVAAETTNVALSKLNVGQVCYLHGYNKCYNDLALSAHNKYRKHHETAPVLFDEDAARAIQHEMNGAAFNGQMPKPAERDPAFKNCAETVYY